MQVLRLSTGYEVQFDFDSPRWKNGLKDLAWAIIGERLVALDGRVLSRSGKPVEEEILEEIRYLVATANELFLRSFLGHSLLDVVERAYRRAVKEAVSIDDQSRFIIGHRYHSSRCRAAAPAGVCALPRS